MSLPKFEYAAPTSIEEAGGLALELGGECRLMAGGTDVIAAMKDRFDRPARVIDLKSVPGLGGIEYSPGAGLRIGALARLHDIETSPAVREKFPAVARAAHSVASKQIRCKATMVGNICNASPSADTAPILLACGAVIKTYRPSGGREIPAENFFRGVKRTDLEPGEIVTEIFVPELKSGEGAAYLKHAVRKAMDLAIVGVAAWVRMDGKRCAACRIALGAVAATPMRAREAEKFLAGREMTDEAIEEAAVRASEECRPISDVRASAEYRKDMARVFTKRSLKMAMQNLTA